MFEVSCHRSSVKEGIWGDVCFSNGDHANARIFYEKAVEEGCAIARRNLGLFYEFGLGGINKNVALAVKCYRQAVENGYPDAQADINRVLNNPMLSAIDLNDIGTLYHNGDGVKQDHAKAKRWYLKADAKGSEVAHRNLGSFFEYALAGEKRDLIKAALYYQEAFNRGCRVTRFDLARLFKYPELSTPGTSADSGRQLTAMVGAAQIAAGAYITAMSLGALAPVGSALISSGANGIMHAVNAEDEEITAWKVAETSAKGVATGLISSGVSAGVDRKSVV